MFTDPQGDPLHPNVASKVFQRLVDRSELLRIRFRLHDLRDGHVSAGVNVTVVSARLGHASASFTLDVYAHGLPGQQSDAAAAAVCLVDAVKLRYPPDVLVPVAA